MAESLSRSDSRLCGLRSVSSSLPYLASDLVVPFQPRWSAPPGLFYTAIEDVEHLPSLGLSDEPRSARSLLLSFCIAGVCMRCILQHLTDHAFDKLRATRRRGCRILH